MVAFLSAPRSAAFATVAAEPEKVISTSTAVPALLVKATALQTVSPAFTPRIDDITDRSVGQVLDTGNVVRLATMTNFIRTATTAAAGAVWGVGALAVGGKALPSNGGGLKPGGKVPSNGGGLNPGGKVPSNGGGLNPGGKVPSNGGGLNPGGKSGNGLPPPPRGGWIP
jgi:hypothetical protein